MGLVVVAGGDGGLMISEIDSNKRTDAGNNLPRLLRRYAWSYRWWYLSGAFFLWLTNYLTVSIPGQIGGAIDALRSGESLTGYVVAISLMGVAVIIVRSLSRILVFNPGRHIEYHMRADIFAKLLRLQPEFYMSHKRGDLVSRAANDISWVRTVIGYGGLQIVNVSLAVVLTSWKMISLSPRLTLTVLLPILVGMFSVQWGIRSLFVLGRRSQEQLGEISEHVLGSLQGTAAIQSFVAEKAFVSRFEARNGEWLKTIIRLALVRALALPLLVLAGGVAVVVLIGIGGPMVLEGSLTVGELAAFSALLTAFLPPLRSLGWMLSVFQRGRAALERIFELLDAEVDRPEGENGVVIAPGQGPSIKFEALSFAYPDDPDRRVLDNLDVEIPAGSMIGIFGRTGSGKSTLLRVLSRLYNPPAGTLFVDGIDLNELDLDAWRRRLGVVPQRPFLFSDTIVSNIALEGEPDVERVRIVIEQAALHHDIEVLQDGVDTVVGERGIMLSGGQRQRVALARGLYRGGDLLILDDVLSAVDHHTESMLVDTIAQLNERAEAPTVLIASHRLSAFRKTDMILVLDRGKLVDSGRHEELVARTGIYRDTWLAQRQAQNIESEAGVAS